MFLTKESSRVVKHVVLAILGTISFILFFLNFPLPFLPPYLKVDFGDIPALLASFIFSPIAGVIVIGIKNFLYLVIGTGEIVGVTSNFIASSLFLYPIAHFYHKHKTVKSIIKGIVIGTILMAVVMSILNYVVFLPVYALFMGMEDMNIEAVKRAAVIFGILPFNILKGIIVGALFVPLFAKMSHWIEEKQANFA
ncbi:MAG TPA: ECF transporter S component [Bacillota bacterium]|nr:ECF transporter S component [Bacillota bacterium]